MRIIFAGTPDFAVPSLRTLCASGHDIVLVLCQPDRPAGRGRRTQAGPVKRFAAARGLAVRQPVSLRSAAIQTQLVDLGADLMVVAAYGLLLPAAVLTTPRLGCVNVHASLLPRWRGAAPVIRAIAAGDATTGISLMQMDSGLDTGPVLAQRSTEIAPGETGGALHDRLALMGAELLAGELPRILAGEMQPRAQDESQATYAPKVSKSEGLIDWSRPAKELNNKIRALNPWPVAYTYHDQVRIRLLEAEPAPGRARQAPGTVVAADADGIVVACAPGEGLRLLRLQREGGRPLPVGDFLNGHVIEVGARLGPAGT